MISVYNIIIRIMAAILDFGPKWQFAMGGFGWTFFPDLAHQRWTHFRWKSFVNIFVQPPLILSLHCLDYMGDMHTCMFQKIFFFKSIVQHIVPAYSKIICFWISYKIGYFVLHTMSYIFYLFKNLVEVSYPLCETLVYTKHKISLNR